MMIRRLLVGLCRVYPADFRARFQTDMLATIDVALASRRGAKARVLWMARESAGIAYSALGEWIAKGASDRLARARALPDCRYMRPVGVTRAQWAAGLTHVVSRGQTG